MNLRATFTALFLLAAPVLVSNAALAHGSMRPQHGGIVEMSGETLFELVIKPEAVELYVSEDDEPLSSSEMTAKLAIANGDARTEALLSPAGGNKFIAKGVTIASGSEVTVTLQNNASKAKVFAKFMVK